MSTKFGKFLATAAILFLAIAISQPASATTHVAAPAATASYDLYLVANNSTDAFVRTTWVSTSPALPTNTFTRAGYAFAGWGLDAVGRVKYKDAATVKLTSVTVLYAQWTPIKFAITFNPNGGTGTMTSTTGTVTGFTVPNSRFKNPGFTFLGWSKTTDGRNLISTGNAMMASSDTVLYAIWQPIIYTLTPRSSKGTGTTNPATFTVLQGVLPANNFSYDGYHFVGWALSASGAVIGQPGDSYTSMGNKTIWAKWAVNDYSQITPAITGHTIGNLLWSDEFAGKAGSTIDSTTWTARYCGHDDANGGGTCWNNEAQWYTPTAVAKDGSGQGNAVITTTRTNKAPAGANCGGSYCAFSSARFDTQGKVSFKYGYIEARIKMPAGSGNWPAFWALGDNITSVGWPLSGELDIAEQGRNNPNRNSAAVHYSTNGQANNSGANGYDVGDTVGSFDYSADYHTYGMAWLPNRVEFYVDGKLFFTDTPQTSKAAFWSFNAPFFLIFNNALSQDSPGGFGGSWGNWTTSQMSIDYVRSWQMDGQGAVIRH